jgi:hypothetical protein
MQEPILTSYKVTSLEVTNADTALFLADASKVRYLRPYFAREASVSEAAKLLELPLANVRYWTERMIELSLIKQTRSVKRKGSPIKYYRTVADEFTVPLETIPVISIEALLEIKERPYWQRAQKALAITGLKKAGGWHTRYYLQGNIPMYTLEPKSGDLEDAEIFNYWMPLKLNLEQAKTFRAELAALRACYEKLSVENQSIENRGADQLEQVPRHICHLLLVEES